MLRFVLFVPGCLEAPFLVVNRRQKGQKWRRIYKDRLLDFQRAKSRPL